MDVVEIDEAGDERVELVINEERALVGGVDVVDQDLLLVVADVLHFDFQGFHSLCERQDLDLLVDSDEKVSGLRQQSSDIYRFKRMDF